MHRAHAPRRPSSVNLALSPRLPSTTNSPVTNSRHLPRSLTRPSQLRAAGGLFVNSKYKVRNVLYSIFARSSARRAVLLSGTPSPCRPFDLYAQVDALRPRCAASSFSSLRRRSVPRLAFRRLVCQPCSEMTVDGDAGMPLLRDCCFFRDCGDGLSRRVRSAGSWAGPSSSSPRPTARRPAGPSSRRE